GNRKGNQGPPAAREESAPRGAALRRDEFVHGGLLCLCPGGHAARRELHRAKDAHVRAATALEARYSLANVLLGSARIRFQQRRRRHDPAVDAVAALRGLLVDEGL